MRKRDELTNPDSCMSKARPDEMTFVLLARDEDAPGTVRDWIARRILSGKNEPGDRQMVDAERCARIMEAERSSAAPEPVAISIPDAPPRPVESRMDTIDTAFAAIGGEEFRKDSCNCDPDVNYQCEYCAIREGLRSAKWVMEHFAPPYRDATHADAATATDEAPDSFPPPTDGDDEPDPTPPWQDRLVFDFNVSESSPVVKGTWVTAGHIVSLIVDGWTWSDILRCHPELTEDDIRVCLAYAVENEPEPEASPKS